MKKLTKILIGIGIGIFGLAGLAVGQVSPNFWILKNSNVKPISDNWGLQIVSTPCTGNNFYQSGASGIFKCGTPSGGASSTLVFGTNGVSVTQTGVNATASLDTTFAASWSALESFLKGISVNGTTTLASTTNALLVTNASGVVAQYVATTCSAGQSFTGLSATGTPTCGTFISSAPATTTINGVQSSTFNIIGDGVTVTTTVSGATTTFTFINPGMGDGNYYLTSTTSDLGGIYVASDTPQSLAASTTVASLGNGTTSLQKWVTVANVPGVNIIPPGIADIHIGAAQTAGTKPTQLVGILQEVAANGTVLGTIGTSASSTILTANSTEYDLDFVISQPYTMASTASRLQANIISSVSGALLAPTVQLYFGGANADSRIEVPGSTVDVTSFVPYVGAIKNVNLGSNSLTLTAALTQSGGLTSLASTTITGNATTTNLSVTSATNSVLGADNTGHVYATSSFVSSLGNTTGSIAVGAYLSGGATLNVSSTLASSTLNLNFSNPSTTLGLNVIKGTWDYQRVFSKIGCQDLGNGTTTLVIANTTSSFSNTINASVIGLGVSSTLTCGINGNTTTTFTSSTLLAGYDLFIQTTSTTSSATDTVWLFGYTTKQ